MLCAAVYDCAVVLMLCSVGLCVLHDMQCVLWLAIMIVVIMGVRGMQLAATMCVHMISVLSMCCRCDWVLMLLWV